MISIASAEEDDECLTRSRGDSRSEQSEDDDEYAGIELKVFVAYECCLLVRFQYGS